MFEVARWPPESRETFLCVELFLFASLGADPEQESRPFQSVLQVWL